MRFFKKIKFRGSRAYEHAKEIGQFYQHMLPTSREFVQKYRLSDKDSFDEANDKIIHFVFFPELDSPHAKSEYKNDGFLDLWIRKTSIKRLRELPSYYVNSEFKRTTGLLGLVVAVLRVENGIYSPINTDEDVKAILEVCYEQLIQLGIDKKTILGSKNSSCLDFFDFAKSDPISIITA